MGLATVVELNEIHRGETAPLRSGSNPKRRGLPEQGFDRQSFEKVVARRLELFGGRPLPGNSADLIREAREIRDAELDRCA